jgi:alkanesulfonate monooxygenase SsuD/methylene tetrahydromethanopterin reductase-like flavin-dependent oxidoreductase (luciferase family)
MVDSERLDYGSVLSLARAYEEEKFEYLGVFDHFVPIYSDDSASVLECWTTLGALSRDTTTINIGPFVTCSSYRHPIMVAKMSATVSDSSNGRHFLGVGLGWYAREFEALQVEMSGFSDRMQQTAEFLDAVRELWGGSSVSHSGKHYKFDGASALEPGRADPIPILVGSEKGGSKMLKMISRYADIANVGWNMDMDLLAEKLGEFDSYREAEGRKKGDVMKSTNYDLLVGKDKKDLDAKIAAAWEKFKPRFSDYGAYAEKIAHGIVGTPQECAEKVDRLESMGIGLVFFQPLDSPSSDSVELLARELR